MLKTSRFLSLPNSLTLYSIVYTFTNLASFRYGAKRPAKSDSGQTISWEKGATSTAEFSATKLLLVEAHRRDALHKSMKLIFDETKTTFLDWLQISKYIFAGHSATESGRNLQRVLNSRVFFLQLTLISLSLLFCHALCILPYKNKLL